MLDIAFIRENKEAVQKACQDKNVEVDVAKLLQLDEQKRTAQQKVDGLRQERNQLASKGAKPSEADVTKGKELKEHVAKLEAELAKTEAEFSELLRQVPNIPSADTPVGKDDSANQVLRQWGKPPEFDFEPKPHWELGKKLDLIDSERAAKVAGSRFAYLKGRLALLQFALIQFVLDAVATEQTLEVIIKQFELRAVVKGFVPVIPPAAIHKQQLQQTGRLIPEEDKYKLENEELYLAGSAEQTLVAMHGGEVLSGSSLPLRYIGYSTNFRREAGSYGQDVRGIMRMHQFDKLEMVSLTTPEEGEAEQQLLVAIQEYLLQQLGLPYQVVAISTGDMGKTDYRQIDIETWMPGQGGYRETHSADYNTDFQARGLGIKFKADGQAQFVHTNDATALALGRTLIAIIENNQTKEGKIKIPKVLQTYMKGEYL